MARNLTFAFITLLMISSSVFANEIQGTYVEARTCQVYTGPCFANGEVGLTGKDAVMSWQIEEGQHGDVDLSGLSVAVIVKASHTLGFKGFDNAKQKNCVILVDDRANSEQNIALQHFALSQTGLSAGNVRSVQKAPIETKFDRADLTATLEISKLVKLKIRKARPGDCICSNESAYYPPLVKLNGSVPGVTIEGDVTARSLGTRWSIPDSRTAYLGLFEVNSDTTSRIASR